MATATQGYMATSMPDMLGTPSFFSAAISGEEQNVFEKSFSAGNARIEPGKHAGEIDHPSNGSTVDNDDQAPTTSGDSFASFLAYPSGLTPLPFDISSRDGENVDPNSSQAAFRPNLDLSVSPTPMWELSKDKQAHTNVQQRQEPSPPQSANSPPPFPFAELRRSMQSPLHGFLVREQTGDLLPHTGQITPPSEDNLMIVHPAIDPSLSEGLNDAPEEIKAVSCPKPATNTTKRKRGKTSSRAEGESTSTKRQRKSTTSTMHSMDMEEFPQTGEGDQKRSRFLERNRLAASKCRQKKKEWTSNLETRARQLQNDKAQLALIVGFLKDEVLSLKGELLKHTHCNCDKIRQYLNKEVTQLAAQGQYGQMSNSITSPTVSAPHNNSSGDVSRSGSLTSPSSESRRESRCTLSGTLSQATSPSLRTEKLDISSPIPTVKDSPLVQYKTEDDEHLFNTLTAEIAQ
ncbi:MAG: hypothetical protein M1817_005683 [Caeruleum heppii]|nr:MAG: hypothetical protein M1817_005683 [Caeruleum heppii]